MRPVVSVPVLKIDSVEFVRSAAGPGDLPDAGLPELAMVGRSNVGKSSLINALMRRSVARTSATPGKTRLINVYRVATPHTGPFYVVDLPGYGYSRKEARAEFERLAAMYFGRADSPGLEPGTREDVDTAARSSRGFRPSGRDEPGRTPIGVLLALDARHPGMESDLATLQWLRGRRLEPLVVVTKIDKLSRNERAKALDRFEQVCGQPVLAVSAATGEGMEDLWKPMTSWLVSQTAIRPPRSRP